MQQESRTTSRENKELLKYTVSYEESGPYLSQRRNGYFRITQDETQFLFIGLLGQSSERLRFPMGSITGIQMSRMLFPERNNWFIKILINLFRC